MRSSDCSASARSTSTKSIRAPPRPASELTTVRNAVAVRPPRPITLPRSAGCTRTSRIDPRRSCLSRTVTSSGCSTIPRTRCSRASASIRIRPRSSRRRRRRSSRRPCPRRVLGLGLRVGRGSSAWSPRPWAPQRRAPRPWPPRPWAPRPSAPRPWAPRRLLGLGLLDLLGLLRALCSRHLLGGRLLGHGLALGLVGGVLEGLVEDLGLVALGFLGPQGALGAREALELLPVAGHLEDRLDGLGRLRADAEPVLRPVGDDLDERGLLLGVVLADLLDDLAVPLLAGVDDDDAVVGLTDLAHALQANLDGHVCGVSLRCVWWWFPRYPVGPGAVESGGRAQSG